MSRLVTTGIAQYGKSLYPVVECAIVRLLAFAIGLSLLSSCAPPIHILQSGHEMGVAYLVLSDTSGLSTGQQLRISAAKVATEDYGHARLPRILGRVEVVSLGGDHKVFVKIVDGTIEGAEWAWRNQ
jgi:hypothetical protein